MSMNPQPAKRPRIDDGGMGQHEGDSVVTQHPRFWFDDGNIILQAGSTQFKVHRSILANKSQIFKDMFSLPQPVCSSRADPYAQSCPIVVLYDPPKDIENLLSLLYDTLKVHSFREGITISVLDTMLRLGRKYRFQYLRAEAVHCLETEFPATLDDWDIRTPFKYIKEEDTTLFAALYLAHEHSIKSILPSIYLSFGVQYINNHIQKSLSLPEKRHVLKTNEPLSFFLGREKLFSATSKVILKFQEEIPSLDCDYETCISVAQRLVRRFLRDGIDNVFNFVFSHDFTANLKDELCPDCNQIRARHLDGARGKLWDALPKYFGLHTVVWDASSDSSDDTDEDENSGGNE
ncbi:hypothetical protein GALMADRAFT_138537 [Galerina marginata CBS 339.88]|uniref:BTB domain-containing protein n=1 Tax=Galerina marginata (strain CBS 339.88) TaxID=685588 RepID=A0A067T2N6_GALM3|nr:hypothetical protein GALMADRAFT_138537 [Galerina marginata CBS 339.88]